ncbi:MAG: 5-formyltetrahydrofolate cyclo-ligase [Candidatus Bathyarchaeia archaeon]
MILDKESIRNYVWKLLEEKRISLFPKPFGKIPNFIGAEEAAKNLYNLKEYIDAKVIFCTPDSPQRPIKEYSLKNKKLLLMATPRLKNGFIILNPEDIDPLSYYRASTIKGAFKYGKPINLSKIKVDFMVIGSVAVSIDRKRIGKGKGYKILKSFKSITDKTLIATTVHDLQVFNSLPYNEWDIPVDIIVTPTRVIRVKK